MSEVEHKKCFGGMLPDSLHFDDRSSAKVALGSSVIQM